MKVDSIHLDLMSIKVVDYNPEWPKIYQTEVHLIEEILKDDLVKAFHIGSTSVPNLKAKPIIDIMLVVEDIEQLDTYYKQFEAIGYEVKGENGMPGRRYFRKGGYHRTHQIHAFQYNDTQNLTRHLAFRDYLRCQPDIREKYGALKCELAKQYPEDIGGYCDGKDSFVKRIEQEALKWHWKVYNKD